ncbi:suppressor of ABI3-5 isoform X1, partial [Tanacetum coccineum]
MRAIYREKERTWHDHNRATGVTRQVAQSHTARLAEHQKSSEGQRLPFLADLCINTYHEWQIHHRYQVAKRQQEELENNKKKQQEELENNKNNNTKKNKKKKGLLKEVQTKKKNRINKGKQMDCLTAPLIGFLDVLSLSLSLLPVQLILKLLGKRHGKCTDFVRAVRKIIDSFEELRQHKQVDGVIALRQTGFNFGCIADGEAALPPSKRLHLALEVMSANVAEDERIPPGGPSALKTFANGTAKTVSVLEIQNLPPMLLRTKSLPLNAMIPLLSLWHIVLRNVNPISSNRESGAVLHDVNLLHSSPQKSCNDNAILEDTEATYKANMEVDNFSSLTNVAELKIVVPGPENRRNAALTSFEASLAALTRTKKTIDRSTHLAIDCAKFLALRLIVLNLVLLLRKSFAVADTRFIIQNWYFVVLSATVVVKGLSQKTTEEDLHQILSEWGPLRHVRVIKERNSGTSRGFAFIDFPST